MSTVRSAKSPITVDCGSPQTFCRANIPHNEADVDDRLFCTRHRRYSQDIVARFEDVGGIVVNIEPTAAVPPSQCLLVLEQGPRQIPATRAAGNDEVQFESFLAVHRHVITVRSGD
jgi:hypothetical protein